MPVCRITVETEKAKKKPIAMFLLVGEIKKNWSDGGTRYPSTINTIATDRVDPVRKERLIKIKVCMEKAEVLK